MKIRFAIICASAWPVCLAAKPTADTQISLPPTPAGNAPAEVLAAPIAPIDGPVQNITLSTAVPVQWWKQFGSQSLDELVARALAGNNDIASANAALKQAQELARAAGAAAWPQVDASYQAQRARVSNVIATPLSDPNANLYTLHTAQVTVSYALDVFGGVRSKTRSAQAAAKGQAFKLRGARSTVVANVVLAVIQNASIAAQIEATKESLTANRDILALLRRRQELGAVGASDVAAQETALAALEVTLPPLERALKHQQAVIAVLTGVAPGNPLPGLPSLDELILPRELPLSVPSRLVDQRPDVRAAAAAMEGAAADVRTAIAARLPSFTISANAGGAGNNFSDMFATGNPFWSLIGGFAAPIFHGGALKHQERAAEAALEAAKAQYRASVLQAFTDTSDALTALRSDADLLDASKRGDVAADRSLNFMRRQLNLGAAGTFNVLTAAAARAQARSQLVQATAARLSDTVGLYQALGGADGEAGVR